MKNERGYRLNAYKKVLVISTNLTSICCVYKEKTVKHDSHRSAAPIQIRKDATLNSDRKQINLIPNKSFRYY